MARTTIQIRVSPEERAQIDARCPPGCTRSEWIRAVLMDEREVLERPAPPVRQPPPADPELIRALSRIGSNLNQATRRLHQAAHEGLVETDLDALHEALQDCRAALAALLERGRAP